ncbi:alpha/beta fold hydrolase [Citricoccus sp. SGAir0253]|uniref:alpha/beta fold hydrolase n=1 Tax=Citricoccus sp. SGAir0253 TaxID=2567881 RepID=UPI0010CD07EA|nr:alpha/beta hydrolase [Citricoccus sp. SGAir0253]QCU77066.1 alpha/beta fold hydrolase [Citricoccus sp. SGAir0253]
MSTPEITAIRLSGDGEDTPEKDVLFVGAGLGTGVQALWGEAATDLADRFQVIGWDLPGHGQSPAHTEPLSIADLADAVADLVRAQHTAGTIPAGSKVYYAGVSVNGEVALQLGLDHGELFDGIAVVCSGAKIGQPQAWRERAEFVAKAGTPSMVAGSAERWFAPGFIEKHPERTTRLLHTLQEADRFSYARICEALADFDVRERLGEISTPILALNGAVDEVCPPEVAEQTAAGVQHGTAVVLEHVAHQAPAEDPEGTARVLKEHFGADRAR